MFYNVMGSMLLNGQIQKEPWILVDLLTTFFGFFMNIFYNLIDFVFVQNTLGVAIIALTIFVRLLMLPMAVKQQKSMTKMQSITPEIEAIRKKYGDTKDPELAQKMNREMQEIYTKNGVNPFSGCLPIFIQMPMFIALNYVMNQPYQFINKIGGLYTQLAENIMSITGYYDSSSIFYEIAVSKVPKGMTIDLKIVDDVKKVLNMITEAEWTQILTSAPAEITTNLTGVLSELHNIEYFLGIDLTAACGWSLPGIIIPLLAAGTTFLSSYLMMRKQPKAQEGTAAQTQKMMMYFMPIMMGFLTVSLTAGVGVYWITSNIFQIIQQMIINKSVEKEKQALSQS